MDDIPEDAYTNLPKAWLETRKTAVLNALSNGGKIVQATTDGGVSITYKTAGTLQQELRALKYALAGRTEEDFKAGTQTPSVVCSVARFS